MKSSDPTITEPPTKNRQEVFTFRLLLAGFDVLTQEVEDALYEAGCDDAILGIDCGKPYLEFDREAPSLKAAILSAIRDVLSANQNISILKIQPPGMDVIEMFNDMLKIREESKTDPSFFEDAWQTIVKTR